MEDEPVVVIVVLMLTYLNLIFFLGEFHHLGRKIPIYLLAFLITWVPALATNIAETLHVHHSDALFVGEILTSLLLPLTGFLNSIVYGWDRHLVEKLRVHLTDGYCQCFWNRGRARLLVDQEDSYSKQIAEDSESSVPSYNAFS